MESFWRILSANPIVVAVANVGGVVAFLVLIWKFGGAATRFVSNAYHNNIMVAVARFRRRSFQRSYVAAHDLHYFVAYFARRSVLLVMTLAGLLTSSMSSSPTFDVYAAQHAGASVAKYQAYIRWHDVLSLVASFTYVVLIFIIVVRIQRVCSNVVSLRRKWRRRKIIP